MFPSEALSELVDEVELCELVELLLLDVEGDLKVLYSIVLNICVQVSYAQIRMTCVSSGSYCVYDRGPCYGCSAC